MSLLRNARTPADVGEIFYNRRTGRYAWRVWQHSGALFRDGAENTRAAAESECQVALRLLEGIAHECSNDPAR